jgi:transcriptional regulator with XRE-family HTH domain
MTAAQYRKARRQRGSQTEVAKLLGVDPQTISRRERGEIEINHEAALALLSLPVWSKGKPDKKQATLWKWGRVKTGQLGLPKVKGKS